MAKALSRYGVGFVVGVILAGTLGATLSAFARFIPPPNPDGTDLLSGHIKPTTPAPSNGGGAPIQQEIAYQHLLRFVSTPLEVNGHAFDSIVDMDHSRPVTGGGTGPGVISVTFAVPPDVGKITYLVFSKPDDADAFMAAPVNPTNTGKANPIGLRAQIPDGLTRSFSYSNEKRFPDRIHCYMTRVAAQELVSALCAYHPPGSSLVAIAFLPEKITSAVESNYTGSTDTRDITINFAGAAAAKLRQFLASEQSASRK